MQLTSVDALKHTHISVADLEHYIHHCTRPPRSYALSVQQATFEFKEGAAPKPPRKIGGKLSSLSAEDQAQRIRSAEQRASLSWAEEGDETIGLRIIVLQNVFDPAELRGDDTAQDELAEDVAEEVAKFGDVERMTVFSKHAAGPIMVRGCVCVGGGMARITQHDCKHPFCYYSF